MTIDFDSKQIDLGNAASRPYLLRALHSYSEAPKIAYQSVGNEVSRQCMQQKGTVVTRRLLVLNSRH